MKTRYFFTITLLGLGLFATAQAQMQYYRPNDKTGLNVFETAKNDSTSFQKVHVKVGGSFEETFQNLNNKNTASAMTQNGYTGNVNSLESLTPGFDLAMANLNIDAQLADGIRVNLTTYLASRHHEAGNIRLAAQPAEAMHRRIEDGIAVGPRHLPAFRAMALPGRADLPLDRERHRPAKTRSPDWFRHSTSPCLPLAPLRSADFQRDLHPVADPDPLGLLNRDLDWQQIAAVTRKERCRKARFADLRDHRNDAPAIA